MGHVTTLRVNCCFTRQSDRDPRRSGRGRFGSQVNVIDEVAALRCRSPSRPSRER
jgi:hypothetical protein